MKVLMVVGSFLISILGYSQDGFIKGNLSIFAEGGYLVGGQITSNTFVYQSGFSARTGVLKEVSPYVNLGLGAGVDTYDFIEFFPVYLRIDAQADPSKNGVFTAFVGHSFAHSKDENSSLNQEIEGGGFLEVGRVWRFEINENIKLVSAVTVKHQFGVLEIENSIGGELRERIDFDGVQVRLGFLIR